MRPSWQKNANSVTAVPEARNGAGCRVLTCPWHGDLGITLFSEWRLRLRGGKWPEAYKLRWFTICWKILGRGNGTCPPGRRRASCTRPWEARNQKGGSYQERSRSSGCSAAQGWARQRKPLLFCLLRVHVSRIWNWPHLVDLKTGHVTSWAYPMSSLSAYQVCFQVLGMG